METFISGMKVVNAPIEILTKVDPTWDDVAVEFGCEVHDSNIFDPLELPDGVRTTISGTAPSGEPMRLTNVFVLKCIDITSTNEDREVTAIIREKGEHLCIIAYKDKNGIIHFP